ncbi:hypothetical protein PF008_g26877 [Phytophthora fragariae]|uniref:Uncharacterized protein n=1 Tax=Phytophthora fragariae TaxID=53985 RepID=A0A6G0QFS4_9STRA|nr:hypothetical protein PF008_g26877 [Phytophthora fragariae]
MPSVSLWPLDDVPPQCQSTQNSTCWPHVEPSEQLTWPALKSFSRKVDTAQQASPSQQLVDERISFPQQRCRAVMQRQQEASERLLQTPESLAPDWKISYRDWLLLRHSLPSYSPATSVALVPGRKKATPDADSISSDSPRLDRKRKLAPDDIIANAAHLPHFLGESKN